MKKRILQEVSILIFALVPILIVGVLYPQLPAEIPVHWGMNGEVDGYGPKWMQLLLAVGGLGIYGLLLVVPKIDPKRANIARFASKYELLRLGVQIFFAGMIVITTYVGLGYAIDVALIVRVGISCLFIFIGNYLGKMKQNYMIGIKTPWTLADNEVWERTHRLGGYVWVGFGLVMLASAFATGPVATAVFLISIFAMVIIPFVYSYIIFQQQKTKK